MNTNSRIEQKVASTTGSAKPCSASINQFTTDAAEMALLEACKAGDMAAWDVLVRKYEKPVYRVAYSLCKNSEDAADISGHVFVRIYQNLHSFRHEASFSSWLFRIVRNTHLDMCVRPAWRGEISLDAERGPDAATASAPASEIVDPGQSPEAVCLQKEVGRLLAQAVKHLPAYQREVVRMYHADGKSYEEIAQTTGLSIGTVKSRLNRARTMLRERLMPHKDTLCSV